MNNGIMEYLLMAGMFLVVAPVVYILFFLIGYCGVLLYRFWRSLILGLVDQDER